MFFRVGFIVGWNKRMLRFLLKVLEGRSIVFCCFFLSFSTLMVLEVSPANILVMA